MIISFRSFIYHQDLMIILMTLPLQLHAPLTCGVFDIIFCVNFKYLLTC